MPADLSPYPRRLSRKLTSDDDLDLRRARGEVSFNYLLNNARLSLDRALLR